MCFYGRENNPATSHLALRGIIGSMAQLPLVQLRYTKISVLYLKKLDRVELFLTRYVLHTTVYAIWRERNARKNGDASMPSEVLFRIIDRLVKNRVMSLNSPHDDVSSMDWSCELV
ncbi:hypothetical protein BRARA_C03542 [Brassica rapa]|uniref:Uncharacterized protein n=1 Tax=Brassica campestris TaxID=3711 RepID=A0A398A2I4_BRACM|nr:hypothetical protein BRARA_C03542 [Brassica rapa]